MAIVKKSTVAPTRRETPLSKAAAKKALPVVSKKKAVAPVVKVKAEKAPKETKERKETVKSVISDMLLQKKFTDNEIDATITERFSEGYKRGYISITRSDINAGRICKGISDGKLPLAPIFKDEKGKFIDKPVSKEAPKKEKGVAVLKKVALSLPTK